MRLKGKVAIVTGAGRGIGKATAVAFAKEGANVVLVAKTKSQIEEGAQECRELGVEAIAVPTDVSKKAEVQAMAERAYTAFGRVDFLVNNAGVAVHNLIPDIREEDFDLNYFVNAKGLFLCTQAVFSRMCEQGSGHIINVSSGAGKQGGPRMGAYAASKFAANGFTETTEAEGRPYGVKASVVCPGPVDTYLRRGNHPGDILENLTTPEEIAEAIIFLACQSPRAYTPEVIVRTPLKVKYDS
jgi:3-oxoacyl-[acyl-carrier protein] reductase